MPENPIFVHVRCGAVYDKRPHVTSLGDNTGCHISERRMTFNELTVQYWAWKNWEADYYGLCHYRRYYSFSKKQHRPVHDGQLVHSPYISPGKMRKYGMQSQGIMHEIIASHDVLVHAGGPVDQHVHYYEKCRRDKMHTVYDIWKNNGLVDPPVVDQLVWMIDLRQPKYAQAAKEYLSGNWHRGYNCYILKKKYFEELCAFQYDILFEMEKMVDTLIYQRTLAYMGELLFAIYMYHLETETDASIKYMQLLFFDDTRNKIIYNIIAQLKYLLRSINFAILPYGSKRREDIKRMFKTNSTKKDVL